MPKIKLTEWGGFDGPTVDATGSVIEVHDIADVWQPSNPAARNDFAAFVLGDDPDLVGFDDPADAFEQREHDDIREQRSPFWHDAYADVPDGYQFDGGAL